MNRNSYYVLLASRYGGSAGPAIPYILDSPLLVFDFGATGSYPSGISSSIADLSTNSNNGVYSTGTGNGTPATSPGAAPGYLTLGGSNSVKLTDTAKFANTASYTMCSWWYMASGSGYPGIISSEGRDGSDQVIGNSSYVDANNTPGVYIFTSTRWSSSSGVDVAAVTITSFAFNTWYFTSTRYNGSTLVSSVYRNDVRTDTSTASTRNVPTSASWGAFLGLRYNNWFNGRIGYAAIYTTDIGQSNVDTIYNNTKARF
jgi:hypothetical protein